MRRLLISGTRMLFSGEERRVGTTNNAESTIQVARMDHDHRLFQRVEVGGGGGRDPAGIAALAGSSLQAAGQLLMLTKRRKITTMHGMHDVPLLLLYRCTTSRRR